MQREKRWGGEGEGREAVERWRREMRIEAEKRPGTLRISQGEKHAIAMALELDFLPDYMDTILG